MSELLKRFEETNKPRPSQARNIPQVLTDMFDVAKKFAKGFTSFEKKGNETNYTPAALDHYNTERKEVVLPTNFVPTEQGIDLSRWNPEKPYRSVGQAPGL